VKLAQTPEVEVLLTKIHESVQALRLFNQTRVITYIAMAVPPEMFELLSGTQSVNQAVRARAEEQLKFLEMNDLRKCISLCELTRQNSPFFS
jgi:hypothetical protein